MNRQLWVGIVLVFLLLPGCVDVSSNSGTPDDLENDPSTTSPSDCGDVSSTSDAEACSVSWDFWIEDMGDERDSVYFQYIDPQDRTTSIQVTITARQDDSAVLLNETYAGTYGNLTIREEVPDEHSEKEWTVDWSAEQTED